MWEDIKLFSVLCVKQAFKHWIQWVDAIYGGIGLVVICGLKGKQMPQTIAESVIYILSIAGAVLILRLLCAPFILWRDEKKRADSLEEKQKENLILSFNSDDNHLKVCPTVLHIPPSDIHTTGRWMNVKLQNNGYNTTRQCKPLLLSLVRIENNSPISVGYRDHLQVKWSGINDEATNRDILGNEECFIVILCGYKAGNKLELQTCHRPFLLNDVFATQGIYQMQIQVKGDNARSNVITLELDWTGQWDTFTVKEINVTRQTS